MSISTNWIRTAFVLVRHALHEGFERFFPVPGTAHPIAPENQVSDFVAVETTFKSYRVTIRRLLQRLNLVVNGKIPTRRVAGGILRNAEIDFLDLFRCLGGKSQPYTASRFKPCFFSNS